MMAEPLRTALYIRVSTGDQMEYSPDAQKREMIEFAKRNGMDVIPEFIFIEPGLSGKRADKRPVFNRMIGLAKTAPRPFDAILVHKYDRFARNQTDSIVYKSLLRKECGIKVISITEQVEGKMGIIVEAFIDAMSEYYSINLAEEVKKGMTEKALRGEPQGLPPLGYRMKPKADPNSKKTEYEIVEDEAVYIRFIFQEFAENDMPISYIARKLHEMGAESKYGNQIGRDRIMYILGNPTYIGKLRWTPTGRNEKGLPCDDAIIRDGKHIPIISNELFGKAQDKLIEMRRIAKPHARPRSEYAHWLSGLMKCSNCGSSLTYKPHHSSPGFQCVGYYNSKCFVSHSISVIKSEAAVLGELRAALENGSNTEFQVRAHVTRTVDTTDDELTILETRLSKIPNQLKRAKDAYLAEIDTIEEYKENKQKLEAEQAKLTAAIEELKAAEPEQVVEAVEVKFLQKVKAVVEIIESDCELETKVKAIRSIIDKIVFDRPNKSMEVYYYDL